MPSTHPAQLRVALIGNYAPDARKSMDLFAECLHARLGEREVTTTLLRPRAWGRHRRGARPALAKYVAFLPALRRAAREHDLVHICDPANSVYLAYALPVDRTLVTCHDLHGLNTLLDGQVPARHGFLQGLWHRLMQRGLGRASILACVSEHTQREAHRLIAHSASRTRLVFNSLYQELVPLSRAAIDAELHAAVPALAGRNFIFHIGSNAPRKNRPIVLHVLAALRKTIDCDLVFAGAHRSDELCSLARDLQVEQRVHWCAAPSARTISAFYRAALALVFPSEKEGFGLPVAEAVSADCPVVASNLPSHREILGGAGFLHEPHDVPGFTRSLISLSDPAIRAQQVLAGQARVPTVHPSRMVADYAALYREMRGSLAAL